MGRPSSATVRLARSVVLLDADPELAGLLPVGYAEETRDLLEAAGLLPTWTARLDQRAAYRRAVRLMRRLVPRGALLHFAARKRFFDEEARRALAGGTRQALVLGAGLDPIASRLATAVPRAQVVDLDVPPTAAAKARAAVARGAVVPNLRIEGQDLHRRSLRSILEGLPDWDRRASTVIVAEGFWATLPRLAVGALVDQLWDGTGPGSRLLFSYVEADGEDDSKRRRRRRGVREATVRETLAGRGFALRREGTELVGRYLAPAGLEGLAGARPERVAWAERQPRRGA